MNKLSLLLVAVRYIPWENGGHLGPRVLGGTRVGFGLWLGSLGEAGSGGIDLYCVLSESSDESHDGVS